MWNNFIVKKILFIKNGSFLLIRRLLLVLENLYLVENLV